MNKILGIALTAVVLSGQARAATIDGPGGVTVGQSYTLYFNSGPVDLIPNANLYFMTLRLPDGRSVMSGGSTYPANNLFGFSWAFDSTGDTTLNVIAELRSYSGVTFERATNYPTETLIPTNLNTSPSLATRLEASRVFRVGEPQEISVVPIGGTLPLMLSALGLFGWAARRRAKKNALPA